MKDGPKLKAARVLYRKFLFTESKAFWKSTAIILPLSPYRSVYSSTSSIVLIASLIVLKAIALDPILASTLIKEMAL